MQVEEPGKAVARDGTILTQTVPDSYAEYSVKQQYTLKANVTECQLFQHKKSEEDPLPDNFEGLDAACFVHLFPDGLFFNWFVLDDVCWTSGLC